MRRLSLFTAAALVLGCAGLGDLGAPASVLPDGPPPPPVEGDVTIQVLPDGGFDPAVVSIRPGATVTWELATPHRDSIAPLAAGARTCADVAPFDADDLTGPLPRNPGGLFVLNPDGPGLAKEGGRWVADAGPEGAITDEAWQSDRNSGAFLRLRWNQIQPSKGRYDWSIVDREVAKAVANGKLYSVAVKAGFHGTPDWIFDDGVDKLTFREFGTGANATECKCGAFMELGSPTDPRYQQLYFDMLDALAEHLQSNAAWYRNLAYVKPSGANLYSAENRLPKRCTCDAQCRGERCKVPRDYKNAPGLTPDGRICNTRVWAKAGYTTEGLLRFYRKQTERIASSFPDKDMSFLLIQAGFPRVEDGDWLRCGEDGRNIRKLPEATDPTRRILEQGFSDHGSRFALMHAGLRHDRKINRMLERAKQPGQLMGLQTTNDITDADLLGKVMRHALDESDATLVEVYELGALDAASGPDFDAQLRKRRSQVARGDGALREPFPATHQHTFRGRGERTVRYINPRNCDDAGDIGTIHVVPQ